MSNRCYSLPPSFLVHSKFLKVSLTPTSIQEQWVFGTYIFFAVALGILLSLLYKMCKHVYRQRIMMRVLLENGALTVVYFGP